MKQKKRPGRHWLPGLLACAALLLLVGGHEIIHEGNQDELFFPALQKRKAFEFCTGLPYRGETVHYFRWGTDRDADAWYYLAAELDRYRLDEIIAKKSARRTPLDPASFREWRFPGFAIPADLEYYTIDFSRKGSLHLWYDPQTRMLFLVDLWMG